MQEDLVHFAQYLEHVMYIGNTLEKKLQGWDRIEDSKGNR